MTVGVSPDRRATLERFDAAERHLPGYPAALFALIADELALPEAPSVVDVGSGTGRASLPMARYGWNVTAIDPEASLLDVLGARADREGVSITALRATAEATGLDSSNVDLVTAAHAFHWFKGRAALTEMARIVRPGGGIALFWNVRDASRSAFVADHAKVLEQYGVPKAMYREAPRASRAAGRLLNGAPAGFGTVALRTIHHDVVMPAERFVAGSVGAPYARQMTRETSSAFQADLERLVADHADDSGHVTVAYRLECWIAHRSTL